MILCSENTHQIYPTNEGVVTRCMRGTDTKSEPQVQILVKKKLTSQNICYYP